MPSDEQRTQPLRDAYRSFARSISALLFWAEYPHTDPLTAKWANSMLDDVDGKYHLCVELCGDNELDHERADRAKLLCHRFVNRMTNNPGLSTVPVNDWKILRDVRLFNELDELQVEFAKLGEVPISAGENRQRGDVEGMVFYQDRVEYCGVDICSGPRSKSRRVVLDLLSRRKNGETYVAYSIEELESQARQKGAKGSAAGWIRDLRQGITAALRTQANAVSDHKDVILSGGPGYRFAPYLSVQFVDPPKITDMPAVAPESITDFTDTAITDIKDITDIGNTDTMDIRNPDTVITDISSEEPPAPEEPAPAASSDTRAEVEAAVRRAWILSQLENGVQLKATMVAAHFQRTKKNCST